jgi:hypothetical protein
MRTFLAIAFAFVLVVQTAAQKNKRDPLTEAQQDQIAEAGVSPVDRLNLYVKFTNEHADTLEGLIKRAHTAARIHRIDDELQDLAALMDELGSNLDVFADRKADIRKSMKPLNEGVERWQSLLKGMAKEQGFEVSLQEAIDSIGDLATQAKQVTADQDAYFKLHPDEKDQDRYEPH